MIALPDGTPCVLPVWMLDPACCAAVIDCDRPRLSVASLQTLRELIDEQSLSETAAAEHAEASDSTQGAHDALDAGSSKEGLDRKRRKTPSTSTRKP